MGKYGKYGIRWNWLKNRLFVSPEYGLNYGKYGKLWLVITNKTNPGSQKKLTTENKKLPIKLLI